VSRECDVKTKTLQTATSHFCLLVTLKFLNTR